MTKYMLKKDTPDHRAGEIFGEGTGGLFSLDPNWEDTEHVFIKDNIEDFDEWFEPVSDEWPQKGAPFWSISADGSSFQDTWLNHPVDRARMAIGNAFKIKEAADRFAEYLKAMATVRQDEGVIDLQGICEEYGPEDNKYDDFCVYTVAFDLYLRKLVVTDADEYISANAIWFDTEEHAEASLNKHLDDWKVIANYDWSRE